MARVAVRVTDKRVLKLIRAFLKAGVMEDGLVGPVDEGTPQGGPLSPLLSNLVLDDLDKELTRRGHRFCRYADDCATNALKEVGCCAGDEGKVPRNRLSGAGSKPPQAATVKSRGGVVSRRCESAMLYER